MPYAVKNISTYNDQKSTIPLRATLQRQSRKLKKTPWTFLSHFVWIKLLVYLMFIVVCGIGGTFLLTRLIALYAQQTLYILFVCTFSLFLTIQGLLTLVWMLYAWENPSAAQKYRSPKKFVEPVFSFTVLLPALHEEKVIKDTINKIARISYPKQLREVLIVCRRDDVKTIAKAEEAIKELADNKLRLVTITDDPINKPNSLNQGLQQAHNDIVAVFDAEDEPHADIFNIINTVMVKEKADVVQSGVQLMNFRSHWFSAINVMEYFFWFKSGLHFFATIGKVTPLGGNTVFFKRTFLQKVNGWNETCLTEDADIGLRLVENGAKIKVIYDELHVTQEETPTSMVSFVKQRTRWNQGFLQILYSRTWRNFPTLRQKLTAFYILISPELQIAFILLLPFILYIALTQQLPILITLFSILPLYLLGLQIMTIIVGLYEFTRLYNLKYPLWMPWKILLTYIPYQCLLIISSLRAVGRFLLRANKWEKTFHANAHRITVRPLRLGKNYV